MSEVEKTFVIPTFGVTPVKDLNTRMNLLSLAVALETGQFETLAQERRSSFVEVFGGPVFWKRFSSSEQMLSSKHFK